MQSHEEKRPTVSSTENTPKKVAVQNDPDGMRGEWLPIFVVSLLTQRPHPPSTGRESQTVRPSLFVSHAGREQQRLPFAMEVCHGATPIKGFH